MRLRLLVAVCLLAGSAFAADPELLSLVPPDAQVLAGWSVEQAMLSPLSQYLQAQAPPQATAEIQKLTEQTGFDFRHDLKEVLIAISGNTQNPSPLILARGNFNIAKIIEAAVADGEALESYSGIQIIQWEHNKQPSIALVDATLAIAGDPAVVRAAIDRRSAPTPISASLAVAVNQASSGQDGWFVSVTPLAQLGAAGKPAPPFEVFMKVLRASGGVKLGAGVTITLEAVTQTAPDASAIVEVVKSFIAMAQSAAANEPSAAPALALLKNVQVSADGAVAKASINIPEQQIEELIKSNPAAVGFDVGHPPVPNRQ